MSKENYELLLSSIEAIEDAATKTPNMPVDVYIQEASDLMIWSQKDKGTLSKVGVSKTTFDAISKQIDALQYIQSMWMEDRNSQEEARQEWEERSPHAFELKNELEHTYRFAFRMRPDLLAKVHLIEDGRGRVDMIQDLSHLAVLGKANQPLLKAIGYPAAKLDLAAKLAVELKVLLAKANGEKEESNSVKLLRDKAYTLLKKSVDEIREAGKFVFWKESKRLKGYKSKYFRNRVSDKVEETV